MEDTLTHEGVYANNTMLMQLPNLLSDNDTFKSNHIAYINPLRYRSYYYDIETNLYYLTTRYYDPETGRFINADDISYADPETINGLNLFAYCLNNPIMYTDSTGTNWWTDFWHGVGNWFQNNWKQLVIGTTVVVAGAVVTFFTAGMGLAGLLAAGGALLTSAKAVGISMSISGGIGALIGGITGGWQGALQGFGNGLADGFMWGGIFSGGAQILSGAFKFLNPTSRGIFQNKRFDILYRTDNVGGGTVLNIKNTAGSSRFRIDLDPKHLLHLHFGATSKTRKLHRGLTPLIAILFSLFY